MVLEGKTAWPLGRSLRAVVGIVLLIVMPGGAGSPRAKDASPPRNRTDDNLHVHSPGQSGMALRQSTALSGPVNDAFDNEEQAAILEQRVQTAAEEGRVLEKLLKELSTDLASARVSSMQYAIEQKLRLQQPRSERETQSKIAATDLELRVKALESQSDDAVKELVQARRRWKELNAKVPQ